MSVSVVTGQSNNTTYATNIPQCFIDVYTFEQGQYQIVSGPDLRVSTRVNIMEDSNDFSIILPPSGPNGPNVPPSWTKVITPMSLVIIGMQRGSKRSVTMVGVVQSVVEGEEWQTGSPVRRSITIRGKDYSYFFTMFSYYALWYLGATGVTAGKEQGQEGIASSLTPILGPSLVRGRPDQIALAWWSTIMAGTQGNNGVLSNTYVPYRQTKVLFPNAVATIFEEYDADEPNAYSDYLLTDGSWRQKFKSILPYPWYEFFVLTAPTAYYTDSNGGYQFQSVGLGSDVSASPTLVGRVNPLPSLTVTANNNSMQFTGIDATAWNALQLYDLQNYSFITDTVGFDESLVLNFFTINPTSILGMNGTSNSDITTFVMGYIAAGDTASIRRYGFRPANGSTTWMADQLGDIAQAGNTNTQQFLANLLARFCSIYEPQALMARGEVTTFLRPDIVPGNRFRYAPFKNDQTWDFYIEGVAHNYAFGGPSTTTLTLSRGLPTSVYADQSATGILFQIHVGNAERIDGAYQPMLPAGSAPSLQAIGVGQFAQFFAGVTRAYTTPQGQFATP